MRDANVRASGAAAGICAALPAAANNYPSKPIRFIVPTAPAGPSDMLARTLGQKLNQSWGQPVVIDNRGGAGGTIGTDIAAKAAPDGHTLLLASASAVINVTIWFSVVVPAGTPGLVIERLNREIVGILRMPEVRERLEAQGVEIIGNTPGEFARIIKPDIARWAQAVKQSGAKAD